MLDFGAEVTGWRETEQKLRGVRGEIPLETQQELTTTGRTIYFQLREYPPMRPGQTYVRTFEYRRLISYALESADNLIMLTFKQGAAYSKYLRGGEDRDVGAWMHVGRWVQIKDIARNFTGEVERRLEQAVQRVISRFGLGK